MDLRNKLLACLGSILVVLSCTGGTWMMSPGQAGSHVTVSPYIYTQGFEAGTIPAGWTAVNPGTAISYGYATSPAPLVGAYSLYVPDPGGSGTTYTYLDFTNPASSGSTFVAFKWRPTAATASTSEQFWFQNGATVLGRCHWRSSDQVFVTSHNGSSFSSSTTGAVPASTTLWVKLEYVPGTGANAIMRAWISTDGASWGTPAARIDGAGTLMPNQFYIVVFHSRDYSHIVDSLIIDNDDIPIGDVP